MRFNWSKAAVLTACIAAILVLQMAAQEPNSKPVPRN